MKPSQFEEEDDVDGGGDDPDDDRINHMADQAS